MQANSQCSAPSSYLVFNTATGNWKVFPSKVKAQVVNRSGDHYRMFPVWSNGVDSKFLDFVRWAVAA